MGIEMSTQDSGEIASSLRKVLNTHGHSFHYAVIRRGEELSSERRSKWIFDGAEFPVTTVGQTTHIDFILKTRHDRTFIVAECKRADPARALWCFTRAPYTWRSSYKSELAFDGIEYGTERGTIRRRHSSNTERGVYHLGFELKTAGKGDGLGPSNSAINQAVAQVLRGTSGLINHLVNDAGKSADTAQNTTGFNRISRFVPAIFTTAQIFVTDADLGAADITTGELPIDAVKTEKRDWIWFMHNRSPSLKPDLDLYLPSDVYEAEGLSSDLRNEFARSIAIISSEGIDNFLTANLDDWIR